MGVRGIPIRSQLLEVISYCPGGTSGRRAKYRIFGKQDLSLKIEINTSMIDTSKEGPRMPRPVINGIAPFFIVRNIGAAVAFYRDRLGFDITFQEPVDDPFFAIVVRDGAMLMMKTVDAGPAPNPTRDAAARWDAYVNVPDPDALAAEFASKGVIFSVPLKDTSDGLRGFELRDADGYVLFFGRPRESSN